MPGCIPRGAPARGIRGKQKLWRARHNFCYAAGSVMRSPPCWGEEIYGYVVPGVRITVAALSVAMSWSGTRNLPGRNSGHFIAPRALSFSVGSARKYASVV
jgi:hypothetical protein